MKTRILIIGVTFIIALSSFVQPSTKLISKTGYVKFYSHTQAEDITADNYKMTSTMDTSSGAVVYSVPMQSFQFEKALMQKHFNSEKYLNTKIYPKAKFVGTVQNIDAVNFKKDGIYNVTVNGDMTIKATTKKITENGTIKIDKGKIHIDCKMTIVLADYGIAFDSGKPATNIGKTVDLTITSDY